MSRCARSTETREPAVEASIASLAPSPEHALAVLDDVRRQLATTLSALQRATDRLTDVAASAARA